MSDDQNTADSIVKSRKTFKRNKILSIIKNSENLSRFDLKKITNYSMTTILGLIDELIEEKFLCEKESDDTRVGRKPLWLKINPDAGYFIGIEFNSFKLDCVLMNFDEQIVFSDKVEFPKNICAEQVLESIFTVLNKIKTRFAHNKIFAIGIGVPGYYNSHTGEVVEYAYIQDWKHIPLKNLIEERYNIKCYIKSNVSVMAVGYKRKYSVAHPDLQDFLFVSIRNGIRVIPVINNEIFLSNEGYAGQLGHLKIPNSNRLCSCGKHGCLNSEISDVGIKVKLIEAVSLGKMRQLFNRVENDYNRLTVENLVLAIQEGDGESIEFMKSLAECLGSALGVVVDILAPAYIVLYGSLAQAGDVFIETVYNALCENSIAENSKQLKILAPQLDENMGAYGAAWLAFEKEFPYIKEQV